MQSRKIVRTVLIIVAGHLAATLLNHLVSKLVRLKMLPILNQETIQVRAIPMGRDRIALRNREALQDNRLDPFRREPLPHLPRRSQLIRIALLKLHRLGEPLGLRPPFLLVP